MSPQRFGLALATLLLFSSTASAHEVRPGYLEMRETSAETFEVLWKLPAKGDRRLGLKVRLPETCEVIVPRATYTLPAAFVDRWTVRAKGGLAGEIRIDGLENTKTDVLVRIQWADGRSQSTRVTPGATSLVVDDAPTWTRTGWTYLVLGVEHILTGPDHLIFVLALLLIVSKTVPLLKTITSFTLAHSITLALAALDVVSLSPAPVEALIALSIVFVAREILTLRDGGTSLSLRKPWLVAFAFGLLHGLGFAGALADVGLPQTAIPLALATFNVGVEVGQIAFILCVIAAIALIKRVAQGKTPPPWAERVPAYGIGGVAAYWFIARALPLLS